MARTAIVLTNPTFRVADTQAGLAAGDAFECQLTSAVLTPTAVTSTIPATGCSPQSQSAGPSTWTLVLNWLQDWGADPSLSEYAFDNDGSTKWYELTLDSIGLPGYVFTGQADVVTGGAGGTFGDGSAATTTATWPCKDKPTRTTTTTTAQASTSELVDA